MLSYVLNILYLYYCHLIIYFGIILAMKYEHKRKIINHFNEKCLPILVSFEPERKKRLKRMICIESILVMICVLYFYNFSAIKSLFERINSSGWHEISYILMLVCAFAVFIYPIIVTSMFNEDLKTKIMPKVMKSFGTLHHATGYNVFEEKKLIESTLFSRFNTVIADDSFCGKFDGVKCKILETELAWKGRKYYSTSFKGVIVEFESNKKINAKTTITTVNDTDTGNKIPFMMIVYLLSLIVAFFFPFLPLLNCGLLGVLLLLPSVVIVLIAIFSFWIFNKRKYTDVYNQNNKQIRLEDVKFAKQYKVFSEDEVEARYLITPAFMERFLNLTTSFGTKKVKCAFFDNKVMFAISTRKNLFEFGSLFKSLENPKNIGFFNELMSILDIIEYFKFDEKIGL